MPKEQEKPISELRKLRDVNKRNSIGKAIETVLNMLKEKDNDIHRMQELLDISNANNVNKEKQIDLMAETILDDTIKLKTFWCNGCTEIKECPYEEPKKCIKQYFERKVEEC